MVRTNLTQTFEASSLDELREFVQSCDRAGMPDSTQILVRGRASFNPAGGKIIRLTTVDGK